MFYSIHFLQTSASDINELLVSDVKKKIGVTDFVSEVKLNKDEQTTGIVVIFRTSESVGLIIPNVANNFTKRNLSRCILNCRIDKRRAKKKGM